MELLKEAKLEGRKQACIQRAAVANRWARKLLWFTALVGFFAVWQHRELAPPVHDGMFVVAAVTKDVMTGAHESRGVVQNLFSGTSSSGSQPQFNAITQWLLDNR